MTGPEPPLVEFLDVMHRLRAECSWKAAQTHRSLQRFLLEEAHETLEAIDVGEATGDWSHLREELGDLLLQVYFHAVLAQERGDFTLDDVARDVIAKMHVRNPHVFGDLDGTGMTPAEVEEAWESAKAAEKRRTSVTDGIAPTLPALLLADKVLGRLARAGSPPSGAPATEVPGRSVADAPLGAGDGIGDRLLALVAEAHEDGVDPEQALRDAVRRLVARREG